MTPENILLFAKEYLKEHKYIDAFVLQKFILYRPEVAKAIPLEEIRIALDESFNAGNLVLVYANEIDATYKDVIKM